MYKTKKFLCILLVTIIFLVAIIGNVFFLNVYAYSDTITLEAYSYYKEGDGSGHAWIAIKNDTENTYNVGACSISPGETITVGLWGNLSDGGVWYNVESYAINELGYFNDRVSVSMIIDETQLSTISSYISEHDYWNIFYNCSCFVQDIWNLVSDDELNSGWLINLPSWLCNSIREKSTYYTNKTIPYNDNIGYVKDGVFHNEIPDLDGSSSSSSSSSREYSTYNTSFMAMTVEDNITAQLRYNYLDFTYEEYMLIAYKRI